MHREFEIRKGTERNDNQIIEVVLSKVSTAKPAEVRAALVKLDSRLHESDHETETIFTMLVSWAMNIDPPTRVRQALESIDTN